jgi:hypothetical protein
MSRVDTRSPSPEAARAAQSARAAANQRQIVRLVNGFAKRR